ncbi:MAG TPA: alpha/beta fold hydrolase [Kofleriaceae bacterium]|nr:alpha/beta fold hydrolase [Kofleriaceae bacterium]
MTRPPVPLALTIAAALAACSSSGDGEGKTYVLVHGAWMGAAGWDPVAERLRAEGAEVLSPELPAHGGDPGAPGDATLAGYADRVASAIATAGRPVILVGHSMGGVVISSAAEARPAGVARLVYVAAYLPRDGESLLDLAMTDGDSEVGDSLVDHGDGTLGIRPDAFADLFCPDCDDRGRAALVAGYRPEPAAPLATPVELTGAFGALPRTYVATALDRVVSPELQARMTAATPVDRELTLETGHVPMLAAPGALAELLLDE